MPRFGPSWNRTIAVNLADANGRTPLSWAAGGGHVTIAEALLEKGAKADSLDRYARTPLSWAAANGRAKIVKTLIDRKDVSAIRKNLFGFTSLALAAENGHESVVEILLTLEEVVKDWLLLGWKEDTLWDTVKEGDAMKWNSHAEVTKENLTSRMPQTRAMVNGRWQMVEILKKHWERLNKGAP